MNGTRGLIIAVVVSLLVGFASGLVGGILAMRFGAPRHFGPWPGARHELPGLGPLGMGPGAGPGPRPLLRHLDRALDLTPQQHQRILAELQRLRARHLALRESTHAAIERELTPVQRARWRTLAARFHRLGRGGPDHP